jgi:hypothetical protein
MVENIYERIHRTLTWKRIAGFNVVLFLVLIFPISLRLAQQETQLQSNAAGEAGAPVVTPPPSYPSNPPKIERVNTFFGKTGDTIVVLGSNFGDYQWGSKVYVGNVEAPTEAIVRWSNSVLEVKIPESARTGKVWVVVNGSQATWDGSLLLYDVARAAKIGLTRVNATTVRMTAINAARAAQGLVEIGYVSEPLTIVAENGLAITSQAALVDALGKKMHIEFTIGTPLSANETPLMQIQYPGIGALEIVRAEIRDSAGTLLPIYADPLAIKILPQ